LAAGASRVLELDTVVSDAATGTLSVRATVSADQTDAAPGDDAVVAGVTVSRATAPGSGGAGSDLASTGTESLRLLALALGLAGAGMAMTGAGSLRRTRRRSA
jgi:hypothetical protein